jgi:hypothetical protein
MKVTGWLFVILFSLTWLIPQAQTTDHRTTTTGPEIKFEQTEFNFGTINQGEKAEFEFVFTNVGQEPLVITSATGSCGCTVPEWPKEPIRKGEKGRIKVRFDSSGRQGMQSKTVTIYSNAQTNPVVLHVKGNVMVPPASR